LGDFSHSSEEWAQNTNSSERLHKCANLPPYKPNPEEENNNIPIVKNLAELLVIFNLILAILGGNRGQTGRGFGHREQQAHPETQDHNFCQFLVVFGLTSVRLGTATLNKNRVLGRNVENRVYKHVCKPALKKGPYTAHSSKCFAPFKFNSLLRKFWWRGLFIHFGSEV
jgi:hypothetical protein